MKHLRCLFFIFFFNNAFGQVDVSQSVVSSHIIEFQGEITNAVRNQLDVPVDNIWLIYNISSNQFEYALDNDVWLPFGNFNSHEYYFIPTSGADLANSANEHKVAFIVNDINLNTASVNLASGITLRAGGGVISNGTLIGNNNSIDEDVSEHIFDVNMNFSGEWNADLWFQPEWFGANETVDDYNALNASLTKWDKINLIGNYEFNTDSQIFIDGANRIVQIKGEGKIENNSAVHITQPMLEVRSIQKLDIQRLTIDGKFKANCALYLRSCPEYVIHNIDIQNFKNNGVGFNRAVGVRLDINKTTTLHGDNWTLKEFDGGADGTINGGLGVSRCLWILINYTNINENEGTHVDISNSKFHWAYGDDGDILDIADQDYINTPNHRFIFRNTEFKYFSRRASKGSAGGIRYYNCTFDTADAATLTAKMGGAAPMPSGYLNVRNADPAGQPNFRNSFGAIVGCTFNDTGNLSIGSGNFIIIENVNGLLFDSNTLNGVGIVINKNIAGIRIENNFIKNRYINIWAAVNWEEDRSSICFNRMQVEAGNAVPAFINTTNSPLTIQNIDVCNNDLLIDENNVSSNFGIFRHLQGSGTDITVMNNKVFRTNPVRTEIMYSGALWDATCRIENNGCNLNSGIGLNFSPASNNNAITTNNYYNLTGGSIPPKAMFR